MYKNTIFKKSWDIVESVIITEGWFAKHFYTDIQCDEAQSQDIKCWNDFLSIQKHSELDTCNVPKLSETILLMFKSKPLYINTVKEATVQSKAT